MRLHRHATTLSAFHKAWEREDLDPQDASRKYHANQPSTWSEPSHDDWSSTQSHTRERRQRHNAQRSCCTIAGLPREATHAKDHKYTTHNGPAATRLHLITQRNTTTQRTPVLPPHSCTMKPRSAALTSVSKICSVSKISSTSFNLEDQFSLEISSTYFSLELEISRCNLRQLLIYASWCSCVAAEITLVSSWRSAGALSESSSVDRPRQPPFGVMKKLT